LKGDPLILYDENSKLDFTYVKDAAAGIALGALHPKAANQIFNITRGEGRSLKEFVSILSQLFTDLNVIIKDADSTRPRRGALDIRKAQQLLDFSPQYSLEDGLAEYIYYVAKTKFPNHKILKGDVR
jgi:nucleoside-diphosphate-sugar epimerase